MLILRFLKKKTLYRALPRRVSFTLRALTGIFLTSALLLGACTKRTELNVFDRNLTFKTITGSEILLNQQTGPVLVNFWSTSCAVCLHEMPDLAKLYEDYSEKNFELIAVAMPYDAPNLVLELATERELPFPVALDIQGEAVDAFASVKGTPTSFLLDQNGTVVKRYIGAIKFDGLRSELNKLLGVS